MLIKDENYRKINIYHSDKKDEIGFTTENDLQEMVGRTFNEITGEFNNSEICFKSTDGFTFKFYHEQACCENVFLEDITGNLNDLLNTPILLAEERCNEDNPPSKYIDSHTWTFYEFRTIKGSVTLRWLGESNGYYSESVDLKISKD
jgi:hypothetical protein